MPHLQQFRFLAQRFNDYIQKDIDIIQNHSNETITPRTKAVWVPQWRC